MFITESNLSSQSSEAYLDVWSGLWLADYIGAFLTAGGNAVYYFHYLPAPMQPGHYGSPGTFNFFSADAHLQIKQPLAQFFASQLINLEWLQPGLASTVCLPRLGMSATEPGIRSSPRTPCCGLTANGLSWWSTRTRTTNTRLR